MTILIQGVLPVFQMPFHDDESIDYRTLEKEITWLLELGCDGVVMGMVSETLRLSEQERMEVAEAVRQMSLGSGLFIASAGAESTVNAIHLARHAEDIGADAIMVIPPVSVALGEDGLRGYYGRIIEAVSIPVVVQDASGYVGRPMSIELQANLFHEYGSRILFKPEALPLGPRLSALRDATTGEAGILEGSGGIALADSYRRGIVGTMPGADLIKGILTLWQALADGDEARIYTISPLIAALVSIQDSLDAFLAVEKYLLVKQGIFLNTVVREPVGYMLDSETRREVDRLFTRLVDSL